MIHICVHSYACRTPLPVFSFYVWFFPEAPDCQMRGRQAELFCLLSGHSSALWPSSKLKQRLPTGLSTALPSQGHSDTESSAPVNFSLMKMYERKNGTVCVCVCCCVWNSDLKSWCCCLVRLDCVWSLRSSFGVFCFLYK